MFVFFVVVSNWIVVKGQLVVEFNIFDGINPKYVFSLWYHDLDFTVGIARMVETSAEVAGVLRVNRKALWMIFLIVVTLDSDAVELDLVSFI